MNKIIKWVTLALMLVGVVLTVLVFAGNGSEASVNSLLIWTYVMLVLAVAAIVYSIARDSMVNPKNLVKIGVTVVSAIVLVGIAYFLAPGTPAVGYVGAPVSDGALKLTDTILILTYIAIVAAVAAIIYSMVMDRIKSK